MFKELDILDEKHKILRQTSKEVEFPLSKKDKDTISQIIKQLTYSQIEKYAEKYNKKSATFMPQTLFFIQILNYKQQMLCFFRRQLSDFFGQLFCINLNL